MKDDKNTLDKDVQKALSKLISDEWFAGNIYKQFVMLMKPEERAQAQQQFLDTARDELDDHMANLIEYAMAHGYDYPVTYTELKKNADKADIKLFESCKKKQDIRYYVEEAIKSEERAIDTYEKCLDKDFIKNDQDLKMIVQNNFYDEVEHLDTYTFISDSLKSLERFPQ